MVELRKTIEVVGPPKALKGRMRPWALEVIKSDRLDDGEYYVQLVRLDPELGFVTDEILENEVIFWFYGQEYVPAAVSGSAASSALV